MYGSGTSTNNYADLMSMAKQNAANAKRRAANIQMFPETKKRVDPKQVKLKEGVAKFLAKREEEEKRQKEVEREKKDKLLQLRHQDRKATNRVRKMLSMTKSANKSCVDDAMGCLNDAVTAQAQGDFQPDEDDYGYTSNYANEFHQKMMAKYKAMPVKPAFPQSRLAVPQSQTLSRNTSWRNNKSSEYDPEGDQSPEQAKHEDTPLVKKQERLKKVPKKPLPPDYQQLLQIAQQKAQQPLPVLPTAIEKKMERDEFEFGRPMTAKEKAAFLVEKDLKDRAARRFDLKSDKNNNSSTNRITAADIRSAKSTAQFKIPKANKSKVEEERPEVPPKKSKLEPVKPAVSEVSKPRPSEHAANGGSSSFSKSNGTSSKLNGNKPSSSPPMPKQSEKIRQSSHSSPHSTPSHSSSKPRERDPPPAQKSNGHSSKPEHFKKPEKVQKERLEIIKEKPRYLSAFDGSREREREREQPKKQLPQSHDSRKPMKPSSSRDTPPQGRSSEGREKSRDGNVSRAAPDRHYDQRPVNRDRMPPPQQRRNMPMGRSPPSMRHEPAPRMKPKFKGRAVIDSDEDYDSEMDDFIDDSDADMGNISEEISRIFKYDRRKYNYEESDDECMESSVEQQMREEQRSLKLGIQEDMEDIRREEEEKRMKMLSMKKKARR